MSSDDGQLVTRDFRRPNPISFCLFSTKVEILF